MRRNLNEIMASQNKMIDRLGSQDSTDDEQMLEIYRSHIATVKIMGRKLKNMEVIEVRYDETISNPADTAAAVNTFLGGNLDTRAMQVSSTGRCIEIEVRLSASVSTSVHSKSGCGTNERQ